MSFELELKVAVAGAEKAAANLGALRTKLDEMGTSPGVKQLSSDLQKQIDLYGNMSRAASLAYDIERGALAEVSAEQKKVLLGQAAQLDALATKSNKSFGGMRGMAQNLGWQMQDIAVQMQMGTNAAVIFTQQGSQLVSAINPLAGAAIAVGGALVGALLPSLFNTGKAAEEMATKAKHLTKELTDLSDAQQKIVNNATVYSIEDETKKYNDLTNEIEKQTQKVKALNDENGQKKTVFTGGTGGGAAQEIIINNTRAIAEATKDLTEKQTAQIAIQREINELQTPGAAYLKSLRDEVDLIGLSGRALAENKADREGLKGTVRDEAIALDLLRQKKEADKKATEDAVAAQKALQTQHETAVKAGVEFVDGLTKSNTQLQKQLDIGHALTPAQQELINLDQALTTGKISLTAVQIAAAKSTIQGNAALLEQIDIERESHKLYEDSIAILNKKAAAIEAEAKTQREANQEMGLTKKALGQLELSRINEQLRLAEQLVAIDDLLPACNAETEAHRNTLKALQDLAAAKKDGITKQAAVDVTTEWKKTSDSISDSLSDALMRGFESGKDFGKNLRDTVQNMFKTLVLKPLIQPAMNMASKAIGGIIGSAGTKDASGNVSGASGMLGMLGPYGAMAGIAIAAGSAMVSRFNSLQDAKFEKMTAQYRQGNQSMGTLLGAANVKSDSINQSIQLLDNNGKSLLDVNHGMYQALLDIKTGISGAAAGFAQTLDPITGKYGNIKESTVSNGGGALGTFLSGGGSSLDYTNAFKGFGGGAFDKSVGGFVQSITDSLNKAIYNKSIKVTDSGIQILGGTLANVLQTGVLGAMTYAEVRTTSKFLGIKTGTKNNTQTQEMDELFKTQFAAVYEGAGNALEEASKTFGVKFDPKKLVINATKLSLKDLSGDALTKEIESFFSSQLDIWAKGLLANNAVLLKYQQVGEGAFETMVRLASQTNIFTDYTNKLGLTFKGVGISAIDTTQHLADLSGGFNQLNTNMSSYYENFTSDADKTKDGLAAISKVLLDVGLALPTTREGFVALVKAADLNTEAGQAQFAALMGVNQAFAQLVPATEAVAPAVDSVATAVGAATESVKSQMGTLYNFIARSYIIRDGENSALASLQATAKASGGFDELDTKLNNYYDNFFKAAEKQDIGMTLMTESLSSLGIDAVPKTREAFRALVEAQDLSTDAGQKQFAALLNLSDAFASLVPVTEEVVAATEDVSYQLDTIYNSIADALKSMRGDSEAMANLQYDQAKATLTTALAVAKAGGSLANFVGLNDAVSAITNLDKNNFASASDYNFERSQAMGLLSELQPYTVIDGSHANGLERVPFDGYIAKLHKGERVQTAAEVNGENSTTSEIRALKSEIRAGHIAIAQSNAKMAEILKRWEDRGMPETRVET